MTAETRPPRPSGRVVAAGLFLVSGAVGLAYEVVWVRVLLLRLGGTAASSALVLGLFVAGLGLGAWGGGAIASRRERPLRLYAGAEFTAALWALLGLLLMPWLHAPYLAFARALGPAAGLARFSLAAFIVLPAAICLGATLPAGIASWAAARGDGARGVAILYGLNTLGAVLGALAAGWFAVGPLGVDGTLVAAAILGTAIAVIAWFVAPRVEPEVDRKPAADRSGDDVAPRTGRPTALVLAGSCGALGLAIEVTGFRALVFYVEGFTASLAAMLAVFVAGLGTGSLALGARLARARDPARALAVLLLAEAAVLVLSIGFVVPSLDGWLDRVRSALFLDARDALDLGLATGLTALAGAAALLFVPAFLLGPTFPLTVALVERSGRGPARAVGATYLANSFGCVVGPLLATFVAMPAFGVAGTGLLLVTLAVALAGVAVVRRSRRLAFAFVLLPAAACVVLPDRADALTRAFLHTTHVVREKGGRERRDRTVLAVATDDVTTASVVEAADGERILYTDDFAAAATGRHYRYMRLLGVLPVLEARRAEHVMVICFGTGTTAGAVAAMKEPARIDVVEVSGAVLDLAPWFEDVHRGVLADPRVRVRREDGRQALLMAAADLDVITLEPLMPYSPAGLPLYTRELYELARDRVRDGGVVCQWLPVHAMPAPLYAAFLRTFFDVFPDGDLWFVEQSTILIARRGDGPSDAARAARLTDAAADLAAAGLDRPERFDVARIASGREILDAPVPPPLGPINGHRLVRDRDPYPELVPTPRARLRTPYLAATLEYLATLVTVPDASDVADDAIRARRATRDMLLARLADARADLLAVGAPPKGAEAAWREQRLRTWEQAAEGYRRALEFAPAEPVLLSRRARVLRLAALERADDMARAEGEGEGSPPSLELRLLRAALPPALDDADPDASIRGPTIRRLVAALVRRGRVESARRVLAEQMALWPEGSGRPGTERERLGRLEGALAAKPGEAFGASWSEAIKAALGESFRGPLPSTPGVDGLALVDRELRRAIHATAERRAGACRDLADRAASLLLRDEVVAWLDTPEARAAVPLPWRAATRDRMTPGASGLRAALDEVADATERASWIAAYDALDLVVRDPDAVRARLDDDEAVRLPAIAALGRIGTRADLARLADFLAADSVELRRGAATALYPHASDLIGTFDPLARADERRRIADAVRHRFASP